MLKKLDDHVHRVVFVAEHGSQVSGASWSASDVDLRGIFVAAPGAYASIRPPPQSLQYKGEMAEMTALEARHALKLAADSNPTMFETLMSPRVHRCDPAIVQSDLWKLFNSEKLACTYWDMAIGHHKTFLRTRPLMTQKRYLHIIRTIMISDWLRHRGFPTPLDFDHLKRGHRFEAYVDAFLRDRSTLKDERPRLSDLDADLDSYFSGDPPPRVRKTDFNFDNEWDDLCRRLIFGHS